MKAYPKDFPHFETEEQLYALIQEGLDCKEEVVMTPAEWRNLYAELGIPDDKIKRLAS